jgi:hypothetical protein
MNGGLFLEMLGHLQAVSYRAVGGRGVGTELRRFFRSLGTGHAEEIAEAWRDFNRKPTRQEEEANAFQAAVNRYYAQCVSKGFASDRKKRQVDDRDITKAAGLLKFAMRYETQHIHSSGHIREARAAFTKTKEDNDLYEAAPEWAPS